jgi:outer membrane protein
VKLFWKRRILWAAMLLAPVAVVGCSPAQYARQADRDAHRTLDGTQRFALGEKRTFEVAYRPIVSAGEGGESILRIGEKIIPVKGEKTTTLTLGECLTVALHNSRSYQTRKEGLYTAALALANSRRSWNFPLLGGGADADVSRTVVNRGGETNSAAAGGDLTLTQQLVHGGVLTLGLGVDLVSDLLGWESTAVGSLVSANFTQPLLRGAWRGLAYEPQYRVERNFVFTVLEFERFTQEFAVGILTAYYDVLEQRDQLANETENIKRLKDTLGVTNVLVEGGARSQIEHDEAQQNLFDAQVRLQVQQQRYSNTLDRFKITLGLPVAARMAVDYPNALTALNEAGPKAVPVAEDEAVTVALVTRPDSLRQAAGVRDAQRDVEIAADEFLPQLDVTLGIDAAGTDPREAHRVQLHRHSRSAAATLNYDLDQTDNRDGYRNALLARDRTKRDYDEFVDQVRLDVRQSYRSLTQSNNSYKIQLENLKIAKRRQKLAVLQQKEGDASARDVLQAEDALRQTQNGVTAALLNYTTTRLQFLTTLGLIRVDAEGQLHERPKPLRIDSIRRRYPYVASP